MADPPGFTRLTIYPSPQGVLQQVFGILARSSQPAGIVPRRLSDLGLERLLKPRNLVRYCRHNQIDVTKAGFLTSPGTRLDLVEERLRPYEEALTAFALAERLRYEQSTPVDPAITSNLALVYAEQGDMNMACRLARQARDMHAEHMRGGPHA